MKDSIYTKNVVHLIEDMGVGGLERNVALIAENLDPAKFNVSVWCLGEGGAIADELIEKGGDLRILNLPSYHRPENILKLVNKLKANKVHILHTHGYFANTMGRLAAIIARTPKRFAHIQNSHWTSEERKKRNYMIDRVLSLFCNRIIACSEVSRKYQIEVAKIHPNKIVTIHNCTNMKIFDPCKSWPGIRQEFGFTDKNIIIASVGRLTEVKGHRFLIKATQKIIKQFPEARVLIVGDGVERKNLQTQVRELSLGRHIYFLGTRHDIPNILSSVDIFVQPTLTREGLPLAITEAMASEKPVLATDVGGVSEAVIEGMTGVLVPPGNHDDLAEGLIYLLSNPLRRKEIAIEGRKICLEKFSLDKMIKKIEAVYTE